MVLFISVEMVNEHKPNGKTKLIMVIHKCCYGVILKMVKYISVAMVN